jgi:GTPase
MTPEKEDGNIEYKLKLLNIDENRINHLTTQMRHRCIEGNGECFYELGVEDDGRLTGITDEEYNETIKNINLIAEKNNYSVSLLSKNPVENNKNIYEVLIREKNENKYIDIKVAVAGNCDAGKCLAKNTPVILYNGKIKMVQDVKAGDILMGDDSTPRKVLETTTGHGIMYEIETVNGYKYKVNKNHILCLKVSFNNYIYFDKLRNKWKIRWIELINNLPKIKEKTLSKEYTKTDVINEFNKINNLRNGDILELSLEQYVNLPKNTRNTLKWYRTSVEFPEQKVPIDPYIIGLSISNKDFYDTNNRIPDIYKYNSRENRLKLLYGLIDNNLSFKNKGYFEFIKYIENKLVDDIVYLIRSLGFACYKSSKKTYFNIGIIKSESIRIYIKTPNLISSTKDILISRIKNINYSITKEKYYGFELDKNGRFLLGDFSVTHNSSLIGALITGEKDNGRGLTRSSVFNYVHELKTGRTSSIAHQILGFDYEGKVVNYQGVNKPSWPEIVSKSAKIISFFDLAGHEKYLKTTILGLSSSFPDICMLIIDGNNGIKPMTKEHILLCVSLKIPFIIIITKIDMCKDRKNVLDENIKNINKFLKYPGIRKIPLYVKTQDDIILSTKHIYNGNMTPIFSVSNVTGEGIDTLKNFLNIIGKKTSIKKDDVVEFHIDNFFNVYGIGIVLGGHLISGAITVGDKLLIGPYMGEYQNVQIKSIYCKKTPLQSVSCGSYVCLGVKKIDKSIIKRGNVLISNNHEKLIVSNFKAKISVLRTHATTIKVGYEPIFHAYAIRTVVKIMDIKDKENSRSVSIEDKCLRNNDTAIVSFKFKTRPQFLKIGTRFILAEGKTKVVGEVISLN